MKHNGVLNGRNRYTARYLLAHIPACTCIRIGHGKLLSDDEVWLSAKEALSLLAWLLQEEETLKHLAQEQGASHDH